MGLKLGASIGTNSSNSEIDINSTEDLSTNKVGTGKQTSNATTVNSGSTNTGKSSTVNSGSMNSSLTGPSSSVTENSGRIDTSQVMLSTQAVDHIVQQMLSSTQGLAAVSSGQKGAGGYNSTATAQLTNDLVAKVAGEVAVRGAKTVNTIGKSSSTTSNSGQANYQHIGGSSVVNDVAQVVGGSTSSTASDASNEILEAVTGTKKSVTEQDSTQKSKEAKGSAGWIICTELMAQNKLNRRFYFSGLQVFNSYKDEYKRGYYIWGVPTVHYIRKHPDSLYTKMWVSISNARIEYLAAQYGNRKARKTIYGFLMTHILYGVCVVLAKTIARNYTITSPDDPRINSEGAVNVN